MDEPMDAVWMACHDTDQSRRQTWDEYCKVMEDLGPSKGDTGGVEQTIIYWETAFPWPLSNRDYVFRHAEKTRDDGVRVSVRKILTTEDAAQYKAPVKGKVHVRVFEKPSRRCR